MPLFEAWAEGTLIPAVARHRGAIAAIANGRAPTLLVNLSPDPEPEPSLTLILSPNPEPEP